MVLEECERIVTAFKERFEVLYPTVGDDVLESKINNGWCYALAFILKLKMSRHDNRCDVVRSYSHWFFRIKHGGVWHYFDAWSPKGTTELIDVTDNVPNALEVWTLDEILNHLDANRVLEFINSYEETYE